MQTCWQELVIIHYVELAMWRRLLKHICRSSMQILHIVHIMRRYRKRFPELEGLVLDPLAYARVVARIGNEENVIDIELEDIIPRHVVMTVSVSASTTDGTALPQSELARVHAACAMMEELDAARGTLTRFVGSRMGLVAPNLSAVCGAEAAAKLVGAAGGLARLSEIPACNIQVLGQRRRINAGMSSRSVGANQGYVYGCPIVTSVPPDWRKKAGKLVANKARCSHWCCIIAACCHCVLRMFTVTFILLASTYCT